MALGYHIGKGGAEKGIGWAMDCYQDFLNKATPKHPNYLNAYHGMAKLYKEMATWAAITTWQMRLRIGKTAPSSTTRQLSSSITRMAFNDRMLAEYEYDKLRKKMANGGKKRSVSSA